MRQLKCSTHPVFVDAGDSRGSDYSGIPDLLRHLPCRRASEIVAVRRRVRRGRLVARRFVTHQPTIRRPRDRDGSIGPCRCSLGLAPGTRHGRDSSTCFVVQCLPAGLPEPPFDSPARVWQSRRVTTDRPLTQGRERQPDAPCLSNRPRRGSSRGRRPGRTPTSRRRQHGRDVRRKADPAVCGGATPRASTPGRPICTRRYDATRCCPGTLVTPRSRSEPRREPRFRRWIRCRPIGTRDADGRPCLRPASCRSDICSGSDLRCPAR